MGKLIILLLPMLWLLQHYPGILGNKSDMSENSTTFNQGTLFLEMGELRICNTRVIIPVQFQYKGIIDSYSTLLFGVNDISLYIKNSNISLLTNYKQELEGLREELRRGMNRLNEFFYGFQITRTRKRRGAISLIGSLGNVLFGLVTEDQLLKVTNALNNLNSESEETLRNYNIINTVVGLNTNRLTKLKQAQEKTFTVVAKLFSQLQLTADQINKLSRRALVEHTFNEINVNLLKLSLESDKLVDSIQNIFNGKIDENLINNKFLLHMLNEIKVKGHQLLLPDDYLHLKYYRKIIRVHSIYDSSRGFTFLFSIPTFSTYRLPPFKLMKIAHFPTPIANVKNTVMKIHNLPNYLANANKYYLEFEDLDHCVQVQNMYFCELHTSLSNLESPFSCAAHIFRRNKNYLSFCQHYFSSFAVSKYLKVQNVLYYFVNGSDGQSLEINCPDTSLNKHMILRGLGFVKFGPGCQGSGPGILFPASVATFADGLKLDMYHKSFNFNISILNTSFLPFMDGEIISNVTRNYKKDLSLEEIKLLRAMTSNNNNRSLKIPHRLDIVDAFLWIGLFAMAAILLKRRLFPEGINPQPHLYEMPIPPPVPAPNAIIIGGCDTHQMEQIGKSIDNKGYGIPTNDVIYYNFPSDRPIESN